MAVLLVASAGLRQATAEEPAAATADSRARAVEDSEVAHIEPAEGEVHVVATMRAALEEIVEPDAAQATTLQVFFLTLVLVEITSKRRHTHTWVKAPGTLQWSLYQPISGQTFARASFPASCLCSWCPSSCTCCHS